jgi:hypothetical protein
MAPMTPLRKRMFEDMQLRNLASKTQSNYIHYISGLAKFHMTSPEHLGFEEIRDYQLYLINERRYSAESVNQFVSAVKFLYGTTLEMPWPEGTLMRMRVPQRLPVILSPEEGSEACPWSMVQSRARQRAVRMNESVIPTFVRAPFRTYRLASFFRATGPIASDAFRIGTARSSSL